MDGVCGTDVSDLAAPNEDSLVREDAFRVHRNYRNILECDWPVAGMLVHVLTDSGPGMSYQNRQGSNSRQIRLSLEYLF